MSPIIEWNELDENIWNSETSISESKIYKFVRSAANSFFWLPVVNYDYSLNYDLGFANTNSNRVFKMPPIHFGIVHLILTQNFPKN